MQRFKPFFVCLLALFIASIASVAGIALGQPEVVDGVVSIAVSPGGVVAVDMFDRVISLIVNWLPRLVLLASVLTAAFPSTNKFMRVIDAFAISWGKARNDPAAQ